MFQLIIDNHVFAKKPLNNSIATELRREREKIANSDISIFKCITKSAKLYQITQIIT